MEVARYEMTLIQTALDEAKQNKTIAAGLLGLKRTTLLARIRKYENLTGSKTLTMPTIEEGTREELEALSQEPWPPKPASAEEVPESFP